MPSMYDSLSHELIVVANKARANGCWFYGVNNKEWLTPEEFENLIKGTMSTYGENNRAIFDQYYISDPKEGIRSRVAYLKKAGSELQQFTERVMTYYNFVEKDAKK